MEVEATPAKNAYTEDYLAGLSKQELIEIILGGEHKECQPNNNKRVATGPPENTQPTKVVHCPTMLITPEG